MGPRRLNIIEPPATPSAHRQFVRRLLDALPLSTRLYSAVRFRIIPERFLLALEQHLPERGVVLDLGCGFGLFTLWFAERRPGCRFVGIDASEPRIRSARRLAETLDVKNASFESADVVAHEGSEPVSAAYCIDLLHHIRPEAADQLLRHTFRRLEPGGRIVIKDITTRPRRMLYFTFLLDLLVSPRERFYYRNAVLWSDLLREIGFRSPHCYPLQNYLPYPHFLLVGSKPDTSL